MIMEKIRKSRTLKKFKIMLGSRLVKRKSSPEARTDRFLEAIKGFGKPSLLHATVVIFLEFFAWGLMTTPTINALKIAFPTGTFLKNGIIQGVKGALSFLSAPLLGALSDVWGRKSFLVLSVFFTCLPIPLLLVDERLYFVVIALSGAFSVTFSIVFAYVADCTTEGERSYSYGVVTATFAASLILSPALGTWICSYEDGKSQVIVVATIISAFILLFIVVAMPESLPEASRKATWGSSISWKQADPFSSLRNVGTDVTILRLSVIVFLSYLPEAGQYSCFFLYLRQGAGFDLKQVSIFIAVLCIMSVAAQTLLLSFLMHTLGNKYTIITGLILQAIQLFMYGVWTSMWLMWTAGILAAFSSIIYPSISALVSRNAAADQQGAVLGVLTGMRGLCNGLGPALFGILFHLFHVSLVHEEGIPVPAVNPPVDSQAHQPVDDSLFKGLPFLFGVIPVLLALIVALFINDKVPLAAPKLHDPAETVPLQGRVRRNSSRTSSGDVAMQIG